MRTSDKDYLLSSQDQLFSLPEQKGYYSQLRYPGGKAKLTGYMADIKKLNALSGGHYIEPFCGGAAIALALLARGHVRHLHLNDVDRSVYAFWFALKFMSDELCERISKTPITMDEWHRQKDIQRGKLREDLLILGFSTFFLNRTNRSGILKGGVIGGKHQNDEWKLDARYHKENLIKRIQFLQKLTPKISIYNKDAGTFVQDELAVLPAASLVYLDPTYYKKGASLYTNAFKHEDHAKLAKIIQTSLSFPWLVSYDNQPAISDLYANRQQQLFTLRYSAQNRYAGSELMIFKDGLRRPEAIHLTKKC